MRVSLIHDDERYDFDDVYDVIAEERGGFGGKVVDYVFYLEHDDISQWSEGTIATLIISTGGKGQPDREHTAMTEVVLDGQDGFREVGYWRSDGHPQDSDIDDVLDWEGRL